MAPGVPISPRSAAAEQRRLQPPKLEDTIFGREGVSDRLLEIIKTQEDGIVKVNLALQEVRGRLEGMFDKVDGVIGEYGVWVSDWQLATTFAELSQLHTDSDQLEKDIHACYAAQAPIDPVGVDLGPLKREFGVLRHHLYHLKQQLSMMQTEGAPAKMEVHRRNKEGIPAHLVERPSLVGQVPDIHGDLYALDQSLEAMGFTETAGGPWTAGNAVLTLIGDLGDRGPNSLGVFNRAVTLRKQAEAEQGRVTFIAGNHEMEMLRAIFAWKNATDDSERMAILHQWIITIRTGAESVLREIIGNDTFDVRGGIFSHDATLFLAMDKLVERFSNGGEYRDLVTHLKAIDQVDDTLFVHAGINPDMASYLSENSVEGVNKAFSAALTKAEAGDFTDFDSFNSRGAARDEGHSGNKYGGLMWMDYESELKQMSEEEVAGIAQVLKSMGVNKVVVGHSKSANSVRVFEEFLKYGIVFTCNDVGMSSGYRTGGSGLGGYFIDERGFEQFFRNEAGPLPVPLTWKESALRRFALKGKSGWGSDWWKFWQA